jgi:hypothetical protein
MVAIKLKRCLDILRQYKPGVYGFGFRALGRRYGIKNGHSTIRRWYQQIIQYKYKTKTNKQAGRKCILTPQEKKEYILKYINYHNKIHQSIHYPQVKKYVEEKTGKKISLATIKRIGRKEFNIKQKNTIKRTAKEGKIINKRKIGKLIFFH